MNQNTEHTEHTERTEPVAWRSRWYSAAKRFGLTVAAAILVHLALELVTPLVRLPGEFYLRRIVGPILFWGPPAVAAWGALFPRTYARKPSLGARIGVFGWAGAVIAGCVLLVAGAIAAFRSLETGIPGDKFTPEAWAFCHDELHLVPGADWRPAGLFAARWQDSLVKAKFLTDETDLARLFDTNAVDLSGIRPGNKAPHIYPPEKSGRFRKRTGPRWWTPSGSPVEAGSVKLRESGKQGVWFEISVDALPDGIRAIYIFWFEG